MRVEDETLEEFVNIICRSANHGGALLILYSLSIFGNNKSTILGASTHIFAKPTSGWAMVNAPANWLQAVRALMQVFRNLTWLSSLK